MTQLTNAISLISTERSVKDTCLCIGQKVEILIGNRKFSGTVATLDLKVSSIQYRLLNRPLNIDVNLSLTDVTLSNQGEPL